MINRPAFITNNRRALFELVLVALLVDVLLAVVWFGGIVDQVVSVAGFLIFWGIGLYVMIGLVLEPFRRWRRYE